jgi:hypothetical protein
MSTTIDTTNDTIWASDEQSNGSQRAMAEGRYQALAEIEKRAQLLLSAAFDGPPTPASRKAEGALLLWRAAYTAAYRELLAAEEWESSLARGAGLSPHISEHPFERARNHAAYLEHEAYMAELDAKYPERQKGMTPPWWANSFRVMDQQKAKQDDDSLTEEQIHEFMAAKALEERWDEAKCAEYGVTQADLELARRMKAAGLRAVAELHGGFAA